MSGQISCNFDNSNENDDINNKFCGYSSTSFKRKSGEASFTGPSGDKTTGKGFYLLCEGEDLITEDRRCKLTGEISVTDEDTELSFWYYMYGYQIGTLELMGDHLLWGMAGRQKKEWLNAVVTLPKGVYNVKAKLIINKIPNSFFENTLYIYRFLLLHQNQKIQMDFRAIYLSMI